MEGRDLLAGYHRISKQDINNKCRLFLARPWGGKWTRKDPIILVVLHRSSTHWGRVMHIYVNGLSPGWRQAIIWVSSGLLIIWPFGTNFSEISIEIHISSFKKMCLKMLSVKCWPSCRCLNLSELTMRLRDVVLYGQLAWHKSRLNAHIAYYCQV